MSKAIEKAAEFSPGQLMLLSLLAGSGTFGGMRLLTDLHEQVSPLSPPNNNIKLQLQDPRKKHEQVASTVDAQSVDPAIGSPMPAINKVANPLPITSQTSQAPWWAPYAAVGFGLPAGFLGTKSLYDNYQSGQHDKDIEEAKKQYTHQLMLAQAMNKTGEETPNIDILCEAMAEEFEKVGGLGSLLNKIPSASRLGQIGVGVGGLGLMGAAGEHIHNMAPIPKGSLGLPENLPTDSVSLQNADQTVNSNARSGIMNVANKWTGNTPAAIEESLGLIGGLSATGMLGLLLHNHNKKKMKEEKANYPTSLEYAK